VHAAAPLTRARAPRQLSVALMAPDAAEKAWNALHEDGSDIVFGAILDLRGCALPIASSRFARSRAHTDSGCSRFYTKSGQLIGSRPDLFPEPYTRKLAPLQDSIPPMDGALLVRVVETELLGGAPLVRFASGGALSTRWAALAGAPPSWEGRLDAAGGVLFNEEVCGMLLARSERAGAACWDGAPLLACEDRGGSFRLAISTPETSAADAAAGDLRSCDWVEVEQILLAPERANEVAALMKRIGIPLAFPVRMLWRPLV
jgi:hypothetical protein